MLFSPMSFKNQNRFRNDIHDEQNTETGNKDRIGPCTWGPRSSCLALRRPCWLTSLRDSAHPAPHPRPNLKKKEVVPLQGAAGAQALLCH